nr:nuclease-related domain-containing protein [Neobacillus sp. Marseille-Q6967]
MNLSENDIINLKNLEKGYEGERKSDEWLKDLTDHWLVLHDLLLEYNGSKFQIDTLIIAHEKIYILDVKNYEGDYYLEGDKWTTKSNDNLKNPLHQLIRCDGLFKKLLWQLGYNLPVESYLIFINPEFHLYTTANHANIIFPTQLNRFMKKLNNRPVKLNQRHHTLAKEIAALHIVEPPRLPPYSYGQLKKGSLCPKCYSFFISFTRGTLICTKCSYKEDVDTALLRSVKELVMLFPEMVITTNIVYDWCGGIKSKKAIRRVLNKNFKQTGHNKSSHFTFPNK